MVFEQLPTLPLVMTVLQPCIVQNPWDETWNPALEWPLGNFVGLFYTELEFYYKI